MQFLLTGILHLCLAPSMTFKLLDYLKPFGPGLLSFSFSSVCEVGRLDVIKSE